MRPSLRLALVVLGFAAAVYGVASLTGGWLGASPWWVRTVAIYEQGGRGYIPLDEPAQPRDGNAWWSGGAIVLGLSLVAVGGWPRRRWARHLVDGPLLDSPSASRSPDLG